MPTCFRSITGVNYPVEESLPQLKRALQCSLNAILSAEPGAGKSTIVPPSLLSEPWLGENRILILQPRRVAALSIARRIAFLTGTAYGQLVGHSIRFSSNISRATKIEVMTEGILTRRLQKDPLLEGVGLIIFDEFHERSIDADLCLAMVREIQREIRPDLRVLVMSATLDTARLEAFLDRPEIIRSKGFLYPVRVEYVPPGVSRDQFLEIASVIDRVIQQSESAEEFLVFLPGIGEINRVKSYLENSSSSCGRAILALHGSMPVEEQEQILGRCEGSRVILSTNIAETSLTVDGITTVIDSGYCRKISFDSQTGLEKLDLKRISRSAAAQRAGRAGRTRSGRAIRLYSQSEFEQFEEHEPAEILTVNPVSAVLEVFAWGKDPEKFAWFEAPSENVLKADIKLLRLLGAVDANNKTTPVGRRMARLPVEPRLARMLLAAESSGILQVGALAAAILSEKDFVLPRKNTTDYDRQAIETDIELRLEYLADPQGQNSTVRSYNIDSAVVNRVRRIHRQLLGALGSGADDGIITLDQNTRNKLRKALLSAFPDRVCQRRDQSGSFTICSGQGLGTGKSDSLHDSQYILALKADARLRKSSREGRIFLACSINGEWLRSMLAESCRIADEVDFVEESGRIISRERVWYDQLLISNKVSSVKDAQRQAVEQLLKQKVLNDRVRALGLEEKNIQNFLHKVKLLQTIKAGKEFPDIDECWFSRFIEENISGCLSFADLRKTDLVSYYLQGLPWKMQQDFARLVPDEFKAPSGRLVIIDYQLDGLPVLAIKIQELFGLMETPRICNGEVQLLLHLLSPAGRPVQITADLKSFWQNGYKQVISELKGRYPKHPWPDNPEKAVPFRGTKKQLIKKLSE